MGLITNLLFFPIAGPVYGIRWSLRNIQRVVEDELTDDSAIKEEMMELQLLLELGDIDEEEYQRREATLMQRFRDVREWRERLGVGSTGGPVRIARDALTEE